jgi:hypothetical protein
VRKVARLLARPLSPDLLTHQRVSDNTVVATDPVSVDADCDDGTTPATGIQRASFVSLPCNCGSHTSVYTAAYAARLECAR